MLLPTNLRNSCYELLRECRQFESNRSLRAIFVTRELVQFRASLPEAETLSDRVDQIISYLRDKRTDEGQSVFIIFLNALCASLSPQDDLHVRLRALHMDLELEYFCQWSLPASNEEASSINMLGNISMRQDMLVNLIRRFLEFRYLQNHHLRKEIMKLLPLEITGNVFSNGRTSEVGTGFELVKACACSPDGLGKLAYALYKKEGMTPQWSELDAAMQPMSKTVVTYARLQQLQGILLSIPHWPVQVVKHAYRVSNPSERNHLFASSKHSDSLQLMQLMLDDLASLPLQSDGTVPLFVFALKLYDYVEQQAEKEFQIALHRWIIERFAERKFDAYQNALHQKKASEQPFRMSYHLLIMLEMESKDLFRMCAWLLDSNNVIYPGIREDKVVSLEQVPLLLRALLDQCADYLLDKVEKLVVEFLLPRELLYHPVDMYPVNSGMKDVKLGIQYQVVVRSLERLLNRKGKMHAFWKSKWETLERLLDGQREGESTSVWIGEKDHGETYESLYSTLIDSAIVAQALTYVPLSNDFDDVVSATLAAGIPVALWPRVKTDSPQTVANFLSSLLSSDRLPSLPDFIWKQRVEAGRSKDSHHQGHYWTLLWDNPNRFPEDAPQLGMPPVRKGV